MRLAGFRADRLIHVALLQMLAFGVSDALHGWTTWHLPAALLLGAALFLFLRLGLLPGWAQVVGVAVAGLALITQGALLLEAGFSLSAAMLVLLGISVLSIPFLTADRTAQAGALELSGPVFGLVLAGCSLVLLMRTDHLVDLAEWKVPMVIVGLLGAALFLADPFMRRHHPALSRALGLAFTLPMAAAAISLQSFPTALAWLTWAGAIVVGDLRSLADWRDANNRLLQQQEELQALNAALAESEEQFRISFQHAPIGMAMVNLKGQIEQANPSLCAMLGYSEAELTAMDTQAISCDDDRGTQREYMNQVLAGKIDRYRMEKRYRHKDGRVIWADLNASVVRDSQGQILYLLGQVQDITERKHFEEHLRERADRDGLTGLHNRRRFLEELQWATALWKRYGTSGAVVLIDLDGFKGVNDTLGHHVGDELLRQVGQVLVREMRATDLYARLGGDEFVCFLGAVEREEALAVSERLLGAIAGITRSGQYQSVRVTGSAGIAMLPEDGTEPDQLLVKADMAMYQAKRLGKNQAVVYGPDSATVFQASHRS